MLWSKATYNRAMTKPVAIGRYLCLLLVCCVCAAGGEPVRSAEPQPAVNDPTGDVLS